MQAMFGRIFLILTILTFFSPSLLQAATEQRTALVIGNGAYSSGPLKNPVNDASDMAAALRRFGFKVNLKKNANLEAMEGAIEDFGNQLKRGGVGLFYYAGHGVQVNGINYLIPVDAKINRESDVRYKAVDAGRILDEMANANNGMNIVLLDACRDNPFGKSFRSASRGLAIVSNSPSGTFISYSTSPGKVARDGEGRNSPYTKALLENMGKPGLTINNVFMNVRSKIKKETGQVPWELSSLEGDFYFSALKTIETAILPPEHTASASSSETNNVSSAEILFWNSIRNSDNPEEYRAYLAKYPNGEFSAIAKTRAQKLRQQTSDAPDIEKPTLEMALLGTWQFGRSVGSGIFMPAGHLCTITLSSSRGEHGNRMAACDSNESYWRVRNGQIEFMNQDGYVTTVFSKKAENFWEGPYLGSSVGRSGLGIIHYLRR
jgi:uncharacterized caspase-like protein